MENINNIKSIPVDTEKLRVLIATSGETISAFSKRAGIGGTTLAKIFRTGNCRYATAGKITTALGIPFDGIKLEDS